VVAPIIHPYIGSAFSDFVESTDVTVRSSIAPKSLTFTLFGSDFPTGFVAVQFESGGEPVSVLVVEAMVVSVVRLDLDVIVAAVVLVVLPVEGKFGQVPQSAGHFTKRSGTSVQKIGAIVWHLGLSTTPQQSGNVRVVLVVIVVDVSIETIVDVSVIAATVVPVMDVLVSVVLVTDVVEIDVNVVEVPVVVVAVAVLVVLVLIVNVVLVAEVRVLVVAVAVIVGGLTHKPG
jgi:hypothetical protein